MSVRIVWQPSQGQYIASYDVERSISISGPWTHIANIPHDLTNLGAYDPVLTQFFFVDPNGTPGYFYQLTSIDDQGERSAPSAPFRAASSGQTPFSTVLVSEVIVPAGNVDVLLALGYRTIEIWKSTDFGNSFQEITSTIASPAQLHAAAPSTQYYLKNVTISFKVDGVLTPTISFGSSIEFFTAAAAVALVNSIVPNLSHVGEDGEIVFSSPTVGRTSSIQVASSSMAATLGLPQDRVVGTDPRIPLVGGSPIYFYYDTDPTELHVHEDGLEVPKAAVRYKWRYSANGETPFSSYSEAGPDAKTRLGVDPSRLSIGVAVFTAPNGRAEKRTILVSSSYVQKIGGIILAPDTTLSVETDDMGFCQIPLIRGMQVTMALEGTNLVRELTVPDTQVFDIIDALTTAPNQFTVQAPVPLLTRRSL